MHWIQYKGSVRISVCLVVLGMAIAPPSHKGAHGASCSGNEGNNVFSQTVDPIRTKFVMEHEVNEFTWDFARHLDPSTPIYPQIRHSIEKIIIKNKQAVNVEIDIKNSV